MKFVFATTEAFFIWYNLPDFRSHHLLDLSQQWKRKNNVWNLFKVNIKDTEMTL